MVQAEWVLAPVGLGAALVGTWLGHHLATKSQIRVAERRERQAVYARLFGLRYSLEQFHAWMIEAYSNRTIASMKNLESLSWKFDDEFKRMQQEFARARREAFEALGLARALFNFPPEVRVLLLRVGAYKTPLLKPTDWSDVLPEAWKKKATDFSRRRFESAFLEPFDALLELLDELLPAPSK